MTTTAQTAPDLHSATFPFTLTEDQEQLRREIRDFAAREIAPNVLRWDEASEFPHEVVKQLGQMGLLGIIFPPELGGAGLGYTDYMLAIEELSAVDGSIGIIVAAHNSLCTNHIFLAGNESQKKNYIPQTRHRGAPRRMGINRTRLRLRRLRRPHHRRPPRQPVGPQRQQDLHHERPLRQRICHHRCYR